jgi:hypothetical protein
MLAVTQQAILQLTSMSLAMLAMTVAAATLMWPWMQTIPTTRTRVTAVVGTLVLVTAALTLMAASLWTPT